MEHPVVMLVQDAQVAQHHVQVVKAVVMEHVPDVHHVVDVQEHVKIAV